MGSLRLLCWLCFATLALGAAPSAFPAPASVDLVSLPGSGAGPVGSKTWGAESRGAWMKRVTFDVPLRYFDTAALESLTTGMKVGEAVVSSRESDSGSVALGIDVVVGECPPGPAGSCLALNVSRSSTGRVRLNVRMATAATQGGGVVAIEIKLLNVRTPAGPLFRAHPTRAFRAETFLTIVPCSTFSESRPCGADGKRLHGTVRELVGGRTSITLRRSANSALIGDRIVFSGRVLRAGKPSAGERVTVATYHRVAGSPGSPVLTDHRPVLTDAQGRFRVTRRASITSRWGAWAWKPRTRRGPKLNTLEQVPARILAVRAPRPGIEKRNALALPGGQTSAQIVVRSPLPGYELTTILSVGDQSYRRTTRGSHVTFDVTGPTGAQVQARVLQRHPNPEGGWIPLLLAPSWSRVLIL